MIKLNMQKKFGILPNDLDAQDISISLRENDKDIQEVDADRNQESSSIMNLFVVSRYKPLYIIENFIFVICCLVTPYFYAWFVVFGGPKQGSNEYFEMLGFEIFFFLDIIFKFFVEYEVEGQV